MIAQIIDEIGCYRERIEGDIDALRAHFDDLTWARPGWRCVVYDSGDPDASIVADWHALGASRPLVL